MTMNTPPIVSPEEWEAARERLGGLTERLSSEPAVQVVELNATAVQPEDSLQ